jgi:hypothetical protein
MLGSKMTGVGRPGTRRSSISPSPRGEGADERMYSSVESPTAKSPIRCAGASGARSCRIEAGRSAWPPLRSQFGEWRKGSSETPPRSGGLFPPLRKDGPSDCISAPKSERSTRRNALWIQYYSQDVFCHFGRSWLPSWPQRGGRLGTGSGLSGGRARQVVETRSGVSGQPQGHSRAPPALLTNRRHPAKSSCFSNSAMLAATGSCNTADRNTRSSAPMPVRTAFRLARVIGWRATGSTPLLIPSSQR